MEFGDGEQENISELPHSRWRKQSYLKQRRQNSVWKECRDCSRCTDLALGPSMLGVHWGGSALGSDISVSSRYLFLKREIRIPSKEMSSLRKYRLNTDSYPGTACQGKMGFLWVSSMTEGCVTKWICHCNCAGLGVCLKVKRGKDLVTMVLE